MSSNTTPIFVNGYRNQLMQLTNEFAAGNPRIVWAPTIAGSNVTPGSIGPTSGSSPNIVPSANGSRIHSVTATNTDGSNAYAITLCVGRLLTLNGNMGAPTITSNTTVNRTVGSFTTDGWRAGMLAYSQGDAIGNDVKAAISSLTSTTLVFPASTFGTNSSPYTGNVWLLEPLTTVNVPVNAGFSTSAPAVDLLQATQLPTVFSGSDKFLVLGPYDALIAFSATQVASNKQVSIVAQGADY